LDARGFRFWSWFEENLLRVVVFRPDGVFVRGAANEDQRGQEQECGFHLVFISVQNARPAVVGLRLWKKFSHR
jgi:hypothetical protein